MLTTRSVIDESAPELERATDIVPMIESLRIKNFKCFQDASVDGLGLVNVVVGDNAAGKTALLEAAYVSQLTSPSLLSKFKTWRGMGPGSEIQMNREGYESFWRDIFYGHDQSLTVDIKASGTPENHRHLRVFYDKSADTLELAKNDDSPPADSSAIIPIVFEVTDSAGTKHELRPQFPVGPIQLAGRPSKLNSLAAFFPSTYATAVTPDEASKQFTDMDKIGESQVLVDAIHEVFPRVDNISVGFYGGQWLLNCKVPELQTKIPVHQVSSGIHKLIALLAGIAHQKNGAVMIDEVDNGLYYKILPKVWSVLHRFADRFKVQLIVSTHSRECLQAICPTLKKHTGEFRLVRIETRAKKHVIKVFGGDDFEAAISTGTEVR